jgi:8-oxo-dGTP pyrophosphatase MutT (NUDIX family)
VRIALDAQWLARLQGQALQPPARPRVPLWSGAHRIGSVEPDFLSQIGLQPAWGLREQLSKEEQGWRVHGPLTETLGALANALRDAGLAHAWRDEQLAVRGEAGELLGTVERAVVRPLGIPTHAVHLVGVAPDGRHWIQRRALTKANDPGLLDTLVGGMVPASDGAESALARETWEEAGLKLDQLQGLSLGGQVATARPSHIAGGWVVEKIDWYRCVVPEGVVPQNQDGEVDEFLTMAPDELAQRLQAGEFTLEAALILAQALR